MNTQFVTRPTHLIHSLFKAQGGICFHCPTKMHFCAGNSRARSAGVTREHVFPHASTGKGLVHNIVLACAGCNGQRGERQPTHQEISRAAQIYKLVGLEPFLQKKEFEEKYGVMRRGRKAAA